MLMTFDKYEELNLATYVNGNQNKMVFGNTLHLESFQIVKESVSKLCENLKNPYFNIFHWCKGELFDIEAINQAMSLKDKIFEKIGKNEKKKMGAQGDLNDIATGRKNTKL